MVFKENLRLDRKRGEKVLSLIKDQIYNLRDYNIEPKTIVLGNCYHDWILIFTQENYTFNPDEESDLSKVLETLFGLSVIITPFHDIMVLPDNMTTLMRVDEIARLVRGIP